MKIKFNKSLLLYGVAAPLMILAMIGIGYLFIDSASDVMNKRRLLNGVQIMATVTDRDGNLSVVRGDGLSAYRIDYEFQYTDRQTGQLKKEVRTNFDVYQKEYTAFTPGSVFVASFIPAEPSVNEPVMTVGRFAPQTVLLSRLVIGLIFLGAAGVIISKFSRVFERFQSMKRAVMIGAILFATFIAGLMLGGTLARVLEQLLLR